jgi:hypothetical protein
VPTTATSLAILAVERRTIQAEDMAEAGRHIRRFRFEVMVITDRWLPPDHPYFKVRDDDGSV